LDEAHGKVDARTHIVRCESPHEGIEFGGGRADAKEEGNFDEDDDERACEAKSSEKDQDAKVEEMRYAQGKAEEDTYYSGPLSVNTEIPRSKFLCDRHLCVCVIEFAEVDGWVEVEWLINKSFRASVDAQREISRGLLKCVCHIDEGWKRLR